MCFSATASFVASGGLAALGVTSVVIAKKEDEVLAAIPLMFSVQQAFEGYQWLAINSGTPSMLAAYGFLFFSNIVWPLYVPTTVYILDKKHRRIIQWFVLLGAAVSIYFIGLSFIEPLSVSKIYMCIGYNYNLPFLEIVNTAYLGAVFGALLFSSLAIFRWYGIFICTLAFIAWYFYEFAFTSVWCFFAAVVSTMFFGYMEWKRHRYDTIGS